MPDSCRRIHYVADGRLKMLQDHAARWWISVTIEGYGQVSMQTPSQSRELACKDMIYDLKSRGIEVPD